jgi:hypothetical protein
MGAVVNPIVLASLPPEYSHSTHSTNSWMEDQGGQIWKRENPFSCQGFITPNQPFCSPCKTWILTGKSTPVLFLSIIATIPTDRSTRLAYATASHRNNSKTCKCLTPSSLAATNQHVSYCQKSQLINARKSPPPHLTTRLKTKHWPLSWASWNQQTHTISLWVSLILHFHLCLSPKCSVFFRFWSPDKRCWVSSTRERRN